MKIHRFSIVPLPLWLFLLACILGAAIAVVSDLIVQQVI
jgi:hypothetical protein